MTQDAVRATAHAQFAKTYGEAPETLAFAPGRVNLLGEHTDYNGGLVLPVPLNMGTAIALSLAGEAGAIAMQSGHEDKRAERKITDAAARTWSDYVVGAIALFMEGKTVDSGFQISIATDLPVGSGLSSSAALIVATLRALCERTGRDMTPVEIAKLARRVENEFVGLPCGIMDQFAVSVGEPRHALFLDTTTLQYESVALPDTHKFVVAHCGTGHKLTDDGYSTRVRECQAACAALGVSTLSEVSISDMPKVDTLDSPLAERARHIVTENQRVRDTVAALSANDMDALAAAMNASHASQRDDYAVSIEEIDDLVENALRAGALGARLTGGGFGGSIVALVAEDHLDAWSKEINQNCPAARILTVC